MAEARAKEWPGKAVLLRYHYAIFALVLVAFMWMGFSRFYLGFESAFTQGPIVEDLVIFAVPHGIFATAWMLALVLQPFLIGSRRHKLHKALGWYLLGIAAAIPVTGVLVAIKAASLDPLSPGHAITYRELLLVLLVEMVAFAALVVTAVVNRRKPHIHRAMMMLTGLTILSAATDRIPWVQMLTGHDGWWGLHAPELLLGLAFLGARWALTGKFDRWFAGGLAVLMCSFFVAFELSQTVIWDRILVSTFGM